MRALTFYSTILFACICMCLQPQNLLAQATTLDCPSKNSTSDVITEVSYSFTVGVSQDSAKRRYSAAVLATLTAKYLCGPCQLDATQNCTPMRSFNIVPKIKSHSNDDMTWTFKQITVKGSVECVRCTLIAMVGDPHMQSPYATTVCGGMGTVTLSMTAVNITGPFVFDPVSAREAWLDRIAQMNGNIVPASNEWGCSLECQDCKLSIMEDESSPVPFPNPDGDSWEFPAVEFTMVYQCGACAVEINKTEPRQPFISSDLNDIEAPGNLRIMNLYPNPAYQVMNLELDIPVTPESSVTATIYDVTGKVISVQSVNNLNQGANLVQLDVSKMTDGTYLINLSHDTNYSQTVTFLINR